MTKNDLIGCIIVGIVMLIMIAMSILLMTGKGAWLIAGYNTMSEREKERYDSAALCKFMGKYLLSLALPLPVLPAAGIFKIDWLGILYGGYALISAVSIVVYCNTGNRFRK